MLTFFFDRDKDVKTQFNTIQMPGSGSGLPMQQYEQLLPAVTPSRWVRLRLQNENGRRTAKNSRVYVVGIERLADNGQIEDVFPNDVRQLAWTHQPAEQLGRDLSPGVVGYQVDLVSVFPDQGALLVQCFPAWPLVNPGRYRFRIQASAEDAHMVETAMVIRWNGEWQTLEAIAADAWPTRQVPVGPATKKRADAAVPGSAPTFTPR